MAIELPNPPERRTMPTLPPMTVKRGRRFDEELALILDGKVLLPNAVEIPADEFVNRLYGSPGTVKSGWVVLDPNADPIRHEGRMSASAFLAGSPHDVLDGTGLVLARNDRGVNPIKAYTFAICQHEIVSDSTREEDQRGWHKRRCTKCGFDFSYDSGD